jgi:hypothetical protein
MAEMSYRFFITLWLISVTLAVLQTELGVGAENICMVLGDV